MDFVNLSQALLGIQPDYDGLIVDPCLPGKFGDFKVDRRFRDAEYHIEIHKPEGVQKVSAGLKWMEKKLPEIRFRWLMVKRISCNRTDGIIRRV